MIYDRCRVCHQLIDPVETEEDICKACEMTTADQAAFEGASIHDY